MEQVIIGVVPHKLSATIEVIDQHEKLLGSGRFTTDQAGYTAMRGYAKSWRRCQTDARAAAPGRCWPRVASWLSRRGGC